MRKYENITQTETRKTLVEWTYVRIVSGTAF